MKRLLIVTGHFPVQKRRGSILWVSDHFRANGWHVTFATVGYSWVSKVRGDRRFQSLDRVPEPGVTEIDETLTGLFGYAPLHPFSLRKPALDALARPLHQTFQGYWRGRLKAPAQAADLILVESGPPVMLARILREAAPDTPIAYRVNDDVGDLGLPAFVGEAEIANAPLFDRISVASPHLARRFAGHPGLKMDPMGVPTALLDAIDHDPIGPARREKEAVCAGTTQFDATVIRLIAEKRPASRFHIIGRLTPAQSEDLPKNVTLHGERPFEETAAFTKAADIGLAPYLDKPGVEYQTAHSNRALLYRYFGLPILGPNRMTDPEVPQLFGCDANDPDSIEAALKAAESFTAQPGKDPIPDWEDLYKRLASTKRLRKTKSAA